jgi:protein-S-isoprenylcysteine O-methyltransferase Ste14
MLTGLLMSSSKGVYDRIFGSGPAIGAASAGLLAMAWSVSLATPELVWQLPGAVRLAAFITGSGLAVGFILWSVHTLRPQARGSELVTGGPFALVRHPLYAACLSLFGPGLVIGLAHPAYGGALVLTHVIANVLIRREEGLMARWHPDHYPAYCARTGRFWPRFGFAAPSSDPPSKPG